MNILLKSVEVIAPETPWHHQKKDIWLKDGKIKDIADTLTIEEALVVTRPHLKVSIGWLDMRVSWPDPGFEYKETLQSGREAARRGGFTEVVTLPNTAPVIDSKDTLAYLQRANATSLVQCHPMAAVTLGTKGKELTEMIDLHQAGAVAFSDGYHPIWHSDIMVKSLQYLQMFDGLLINRPEDQLLTQFGVMNEGTTATQLGLKGIPSLAEEMMIRRDISFLRYTGGKLHLSCLSSAASVALVRAAQQEGLQVTCDVAAHQLAFDDRMLLDFDTHYKVNPPFRTPEDIEALWKGLQDNTIGAVVSDHTPQDQESKQVAFDQAAFGIIGLETTFSTLVTYNQGLSIAQMIEKLATQPRQYLQLPIPQIAKGETANLTLFDDHTDYTYTREAIISKSKNSPFIGKVLKGKVWGVFNNEQYWLDEALYA